MTPHEWTKYKNQFEAAAKKFGWERHKYTQHHERDWDSSWEVKGWKNKEGIFLISDHDISEALCLELIRLASLLP